MASGLGYGINAALPMLFQGVQERNQMKQQQIQQQLMMDMKSAGMWMDILTSKNASPGLKKQAYGVVSELFGKYSKNPLPSYDSFEDTDDTTTVWKQVKDATDRFVSGKLPMSNYVSTMTQLGNDFKRLTGGETIDVKSLIGAGQQERGLTLLQGLSQANQFPTSLLSSPEQERLGAHMGEIRGELPLLLGSAEAKTAIEGVEGKPTEYQPFGYGRMRNKNTGEIVNVPTAPKAQKSMDKMGIVATSIGIDPKKVQAGTLSQDEAAKLLDAYVARFGANSLMELLFSGGGMPSQQGGGFTYEGGEIVPQ